MATGLYRRNYKEYPPFRWEYHPSTWYCRFIYVVFLLCPIVSKFYPNIMVDKHPYCLDSKNPRIHINWNPMSSDNFTPFFLGETTCPIPGDQEPTTVPTRCARAIPSRRRTPTPWRTTPASPKPCGRLRRRPATGPRRNGSATGRMETYELWSILMVNNH